MSAWRNVVDWITAAIGWLRRKQRIEVSALPCVKVNLGCGLSLAPGWINIDCSFNALAANAPRWLQPLAYRLSGAHNFYTEDDYCRTLRSNHFVHHDLSFSIPLGDRVADFVFSSHFLEHLDRLVARRLLLETYRILKPGGVVRIGVPDLEYAWVLYQRGDKARMLHDYFFIEGATGYSRHRYVYDYEMLSHILMEVGFVDVYRASFQQGWKPDLELLDNRADYTLFVEARRPLV